jgi:hypothetical protein
MSGQIASNLPIACDVDAATCIETVRRGRTLLQHRRAATATWLKEKQHIPPTTVAVVIWKKTKGKPKTTSGRVFF